MVSKVELAVSPLPGVSLNGVVTTTARASSTAAGDPMVLELKVTNTKVLGSPIPNIDQIAFPVEAAFEQIEAAHNSFRGDNAAETDKVRRQRQHPPSVRVCGVVSRRPRPDG